MQDTGYLPKHLSHVSSPVATYTVYTLEKYFHDKSIAIVYACTHMLFECVKILSRFIILVGRAQSELVTIYKNI